MLVVEQVLHLLNLQASLVVLLTMLLGGEKFIVNGLFFKYPIDKEVDTNHYMCVFAWFF